MESYIYRIMNYLKKVNLINLVNPIQHKMIIDKEEYDKQDMLKKKKQKEYLQKSLGY
jgi:hypothetical protein